MKATVIVLCSSLGAVLAACVPSDAGYSDVRRLTTERIGRDVRWDAHDSSPGMDQRTRDLLHRPLDADAAVQIALANNQGIQAAFEELGVARGRLVEALRLPNPMVDAALRFHNQGNVRPEISLEATLSLTDLLFLPWKGGAAGAELDAAKISVTGRVLDLAFETRSAFYEYQAATQTLELRRSVLEALRASFEAAQSLHDAGNITDLNLANEQALYEESRLSFARAEVNAVARRDHLSSLMGLWGSDVGWTAVERLAEPTTGSPTLSKLESDAVGRSLDLELARRRFEASAKAANLARIRGWVPDLRAGVAAEREHDDDLGWTVGPAVGLEIPLFYQGQGESAVALAEARREQKCYAETAVRIRTVARATASRLEATTKSVAYYHDVLLPLRQQILDATQLEYNAMSVGVFQLLQAKREQIEAARQYVELLRDYWLLRAEAEQLLAGRLPRNEPSSDGVRQDASEQGQARQEH